MSPWEFAEPACLMLEAFAQGTANAAQFGWAAGVSRCKDKSQWLPVVNYSSYLLVANGQLYNRVIWCQHYFYHYYWYVLTCIFMIHYWFLLTPQRFTWEYHVLINHYTRPCMVVESWISESPNNCVYNSCVLARELPISKNVTWQWWLSTSILTSVIHYWIMVVIHWWYSNRRFFLSHWTIYGWY